MASETETSSSQNSQPIVRLGLCEVCNHTEAKYTCPKCEVKTCCVRCLQIHKKELNCTGIRDKTKFIPIRDMTKRDFASDYTFLEECTRYVADRKRDQLKRHTRYNKTLPAHLFKLRAAANERRTQLRFLLALFSRHAANTTFYDWKTRVIRWRIEWVFPNAAAVRYADARCDERLPLEQLLRKYCELQRPEPVAAATVKDESEKPAADEQEPQTDAMRKVLEFYQSRGVAAMRVLLKAEGIRRSGTRYWELDGKRTLRENLAGKTIVEFPVMYVVYDDVVKEFDVIDSDEDVAAETERHKLELETTSSSSKPQRKSAESSLVGLNDEMRELKLKQRRQERRAKRELRAKSTKNLMFAELGEGVEGAPDTSDENDSEADDGNETEEEDREQQGNAKDVRDRFVADDEEYEDVLEAKRMKLGA